MRSSFCLAFALICATGVGTAFAGEAKKSPYSAEDIVKFMVAQGKLGATRAVCIGSDDECAASAPKAQGFDLVVNFDLNSAKLTPESKERLLTVAAALSDAALEKQAYRVEGFTDALGSENYNLELSQQRAKSVEQFLVENKIDSTRLTVIGMGEKSPRDPNPYAADNRRVELKLKFD